MRRILVVVSGRADASPMTPVITALAVRGFSVPISEPVTGEYAPTNPAVRMAGQLRWVTQDIEEHLPDIVLLLGDRYETLAAAAAATLARVPIAHIHGGEASFGSFDNQIRDAVTKLAHIHLVAAEPFRERLMAIGEDPVHIYTVGAPGLDNFPNLPKRTLGKYFLVTYHPPTLAETGGIKALLKALDFFPDYRVIWTGSNADPGGQEIENAVIAWGKADRWTFLALDAYLKLARNAAAIIGNSSAGIIEAPALEVPTVNVGPRQDGRLKGPSVMDCREHHAEIGAAIHRALAFVGPFDNPYGGPGASAKIADVLADIDLDGILVKRWSS